MCARINISMFLHQHESPQGRTKTEPNKSWCTTLNTATVCRVVKMIVVCLWTSSHFTAGAISATVFASRCKSLRQVSTRGRQSCAGAFGSHVYSEGELVDFWLYIILSLFASLSKVSRLQFCFLWRLFRTTLLQHDLAEAFACCLHHFIISGNYSNRST